MLPVRFHKCKSKAARFLSNLSRNFRLQRQLNNALQQAGIYTINMTIFGVDEAVDTLGQIYRLPSIYIQYQNGTWLDAPLQLNAQLYQILLSVQMQRLVTTVYRLSTAYSYFYPNTLTTNDQNYLQNLILTLYNQQSKTKHRKFF
jgi:hypothetical protein